MIAVMESDVPFIARLSRLYEEIEPRVGLDLFVYTPAEFDEMREWAFVRRALAEGKVLHGGHWWRPRPLLHPDAIPERLARRAALERVR